MKKIIFITFYLCFAISCKAQSPIYNIGELSGIIIPQNAYIKDTYNELEQFEGTYVCDSVGIYFKIVLKKSPMAFDGHHYEDLIIGEFQYEDINNSLNTLSQIDVIYPAQYAHSIAGFGLLTNLYPPKCNDCLPNEKRLRVSICDGRFCGSFIIRKKVQNGQIVLNVLKTSTHLGRLASEPDINPIVRDGYYTFIKQP